MEAFFISPVGLSFIDELSAQLTILKSIDLNASLSLSSFESQGVVMANLKTTSFLFDEETSLANPRNSSRNSFIRSRSLCSGDGSATVQLQDLYRLFQTDTSWSQIDPIEEAVVVVTASVPHAIVKTSMSFITLLGYGAEKIFCHCLDHYVDYDSLMFPDELTQPRGVISNFYEAIASQGLGHMIIKLMNSENRSIPCSIHGFAVGKPNMSTDFPRDTGSSLSYSEA